MTAKLYAMPASHPSIAAALMLDHKGIEYRMVWLVLPFTGPILRLSGFPRRTVPAVRLDGRKIQGSREISAAIEELRPTLLARLRLLALDGTLARAEPKTLRYRVLHTAARLVRGGRRRTLKIAATWPWAAEITTAWQRIQAIPHPT